MWQQAIDGITPREPVNPPPSDWRNWLARYFGSYLRPPFATYHAEFWAWVWKLEAETSERPFVAIWPRGFAKSTSVEVACAAVAARGTRRYGLYVCATQDAADKHVQNVAGLLESKAFSESFPQVGERRLGKYGDSRGWRRNRLSTASGFTLDAAGFDTGIRGLKDEESRPDFIIFDDIDHRHDSPEAVDKKIVTLTESILPARADHAAVVFAQNLIHKNGIVARLADGRADFLNDRVVSGPHPALIDPEYERVGEKWTIVAGTPTWDAMPVTSLETTLNTIGLKAFKREEQHDVRDAEGALWTQEIIDTTRELKRTMYEIPMSRVVIGVDPPGAKRGAECGIVGCGLGFDHRGYTLGDFSKQGSPSEWGTAVIAAYDKLLADAIVVERNYGGDMVAHTLRTIRDNLNIIEVTASRNKQIRAEPISSLTTEGKTSHVGYFPALEEEQTTWVPNTKAPSPNRIDAYVWAMTELMIGDEQEQIIVANPADEYGYVISPV